jgi:hypothetical protein
MDVDPQRISVASMKAIRDITNRAPLDTAYVLFFVRVTPDHPSYGDTPAPARTGSAGQDDSDDDVKETPASIASVYTAVDIQQGPATAVRATVPRARRRRGLNLCADPAQIFEDNKKHVVGEVARPSLTDSCYMNVLNSLCDSQQRESRPHHAGASA